MIPNYKTKVEECKALYPEAWSHAHVHGDPKAWDFVRLLAAYIHEDDKSVGLNGKRGNPVDLSMDALNMLCSKEDSAGRTPDGQPCVVIDCIIGAGGPNPLPGWGVFTTAVEGSGAWVKPGEVVIPPVPGPTPPTNPALISRDDFYARFKEIDAYYGAKEGLQRPGGMVIDSADPVRSDHEAMGKWGYDLMLGKSVEDCKKEIRQSDEWKTKHPGETP